MPIYNDKFEIVQQHLPFLVDVTDLVPSDIPFKGKIRMHSKFLRLCVVLGLAVRPFSVTHEWTFATRHSNMLMAKKMVDMPTSPHTTPRLRA